MHHARRYLPVAAITIVALATAIACGSPDDTATTEPFPTAGITATVTDADNVAAVSSAVPSVPHRGYNVIGADDAPIVLYDYSDFV